MGAGKTAIGRRLARKLGWDFVDTDMEIQRRTGVDIPFIFEKEGEEGFRLREARALAELLVEPRRVIATGGGAVLAQANRAMMQERAVVVFLSAEVNSQLERTRRGRHRPLLDEPDPEAVLARLYAERLPLYRESATLEVATDGRHVEEVARQLCTRLPADFPEMFDE